MRIDDTRILVLGATGDIGTALTRTLVAEGAHVLAQGRDVVRLDVLAVRHGHRVSTIACDLTTADGRARLVEAAASARLDAVVNLVGTNRFDCFEDLPEAAIAPLLDATLVAPMRCIHALLPALRRTSADGARRVGERTLVVNVGSVFGHIGYAGNATYCAAKFGLRGFSEALGRELADTPVRVLHVAPRATRTRFNDARVNALNAALGQHEDTPDAVALAILHAMRAETTRRVLGMPERFFAWLNACAPTLVDLALRAKLADIRRFARAAGRFPPVAAHAAETGAHE